MQTQRIQLLAESVPTEKTLSESTSSQHTMKADEPIQPTRESLLEDQERSLRAREFALTHRESLINIKEAEFTEKDRLFNIRVAKHNSDVDKFKLLTTSSRVSPERKSVHSLNTEEAMQIDKTDTPIKTRWSRIRSQDAFPSAPSPNQPLISPLTRLKMGDSRVFMQPPLR